MPPDLSQKIEFRVKLPSKLAPSDYVCLVNLLPLFWSFFGLFGSSSVKSDDFHGIRH